MLALEHGVDDDAGDALAQPGGDAFAVRFETGNGGDGPFARRQPLGNRGVVRRGLLCCQPATFAGQNPQTGGCPPAHEAATGNVAVRIALPHAQQGLSVVVHLDLPSTHRDLGKKPPRVAMNG